MILTLKQASELLLSGEVVAIPTETVYGLAADAFNPLAVEKIFLTKGRPSDNPLIVHICSLDQLAELTPAIPASARTLAEAFWPGPLTLVIGKRPEVPDIVTGGLPTVAVRMPDHPLTLDLIRLTGPLTAPSANRSGTPSPTRPSHIADDYNSSVDILDGGECKIGIESTVLDLTSKPVKILRPGAITAEMIQHKTGIETMYTPDDQKDLNKSPGTRYTHYKPKATVRWISRIPGQFKESAYYLLHSDTPGDSEGSENVISFSGDFSLFAQKLYDHFRTADWLGCSEIIIEDLPPDQFHPLLPALRDRISKASGGEQSDYARGTQD